MTWDGERESALVEQIRDRAMVRRLDRRRTKRPGAYRPTMLKFPLSMAGLRAVDLARRGRRRI